LRAIQPPNRGNGAEENGDAEERCKLDEAAKSDRESKPKKEIPNGHKKAQIDKAISSDSSPEAGR